MEFHDENASLTGLENAYTTGDALGVRYYAKQFLRAARAINSGFVRYQNNKFIGDEGRAEAHSEYDDTLRWLDARTEKLVHQAFLGKQRPDAITKFRARLGVVNRFNKAFLRTMDEMHVEATTALAGDLPRPTQPTEPDE